MDFGSRRCYAVLLSGIFLITASGCRRQIDTAGTQQAASVSRYPLRGLVLGKSATSHKVTIRQDTIRGFMPETNAVYTIANPDLFQQLKPGDAITADVLVPSDSSNYRLKNVKVVAESRGPSALASLPPHQLLIGEQVPDIPLVNQDGKTVHFRQFHGKAVLITFIDTQCTDDCPIITGLFGKVNTLLRGHPSAYADSALISVSIDPKFDTPPVLRRYGLKYLHGDAEDFSHWEFVDLPPERLKRLATAFGVMYKPVKGDIIHTMETALIAPDGTVVEQWGGDDWNPKIVAEAIEAASEKPVRDKAAS